MKKNKLLWITTIICLLPMILSFILYDRLPSEIAIHFNEAGVPDDYAPKAFAAFGLPALMAGFNIFIHFMLNADPKKRNAAPAMKYMGKWLIPIMSVILVPVTLFIARGYKVPIEMVVSAMIGVIIVICGNYLPKCKQNYTVGIKLPWTLNSELNWNKTHHMAGYLWVIGGICIIISSFIPLSNAFITLIIVLVITIIPCFYSYWLYRRGI